MNIETDDEGPILDPILAMFDRPKTERDFPGRTPPRNRTTTPEPEPDDDWLAGVSYREYLIEGVLHRFYTVGALASILGRSPVTIRSWEQKGWLPRARYRSPPPSREQIPGRDPIGKRLYTQQQVECVVEAYRQYINIPKKPNWQGFREHIIINYPRQ